MQATCFKSMKAKVVEHAQSIGWDVTVFADVSVPDPTLRPVFAKLMVREGLVSSSVDGQRRIRVTGVGMSTQMESKLAALRWAQQESVVKPDAYLFLRPDLEFKQVLRLPKPSMLGDWIMQPFQEGSIIDGFKHICQNSTSGMPQVSDLATLIPSVRMHEYKRWLEDTARELMLNRQLQDQIDSTNLASERKTKEPGLPRPATVYDFEHNMCDAVQKVRFFLDTCHNSNTMLQWNPLLRIAGRAEVGPVILQKKGGLYNEARMHHDRKSVQSRPCVSAERKRRTKVSMVSVELLGTLEALASERGWARGRA